MIYLFGTCHRGEICGLNKLIKNEIQEAEPLGPEGITISNRLTGKAHLTTKEAAEILMVTVADYLDQMVELNGWRDHHQIDV